MKRDIITGKFDVFETSYSHDHLFCTPQRPWGRMHSLLSTPRRYFLFPLQELLRCHGHVPPGESRWMNRASRRLSRCLPGLRAEHDRGMHAERQVL